MPNPYQLFTDGGARGNPGPSAIGFVIMKAGRVVEKKGRVIGTGTNNEAEYTALIDGLTACRAYTSGPIQCFSDSKLMVNQLNGAWKVKSDSLRCYYNQAKAVTKYFTGLTIRHVRRENHGIRKADKLVNRALDLQAGIPVRTEHRRKRRTTGRVVRDGDALNSYANREMFGDTDADYIDSTEIGNK